MAAAIKLVAFALALAALSGAARGQAGGGQIPSSQECGSRVNSIGQNNLLFRCVARGAADRRDARRGRKIDHSPRIPSPQAERVPGRRLQLVLLAGGPVGRSPARAHESWWPRLRAAGPAAPPPLQRCSQGAPAPPLSPYPGQRPAGWLGRAGVLPVQPRRAFHDALHHLVQPAGPQRRRHGRLHSGDVRLACVRRKGGRGGPGVGWGVALRSSACGTSRPAQPALLFTARLARIVGTGGDACECAPGAVPRVMPSI
jgi:hypothetical protein